MGRNRLSALGEESWGERLHRAYRAQRALTGENYAQVVDRISQVHPTHQTSIIRLESYPEVPPQARTRLLAYLTVMAYGFNPEDFGLTKDNVPLGGYDLKKVSDLLIRRSGCIGINAA